MPQRILFVIMVSFFYLSSGCAEDDNGGDVDNETNVDNGDLSISFESTEDPILKVYSEWLSGTADFEAIASVMNNGLRFPKDLPVRHIQCDTVNAFYVPGEPGPGVFMCYELADHVYKTFRNAGIDDAMASSATINTWIFVLFHEIGHALVDYYDLPITGREEDAVDDFSTVLLVNAGLSSAAIDAAFFWLLSSQTPTSTQFADEHSLSQQRFYNVLCIVYGSDPVKHSGLVPDFLPQDRADRCPNEYVQKNNSWNTLLEPWEQ